MKVAPLYFSTIRDNEKKHSANVRNVAIIENLSVKKLRVINPIKT